MKITLTQKIKLYLDSLNISVIKGSYPRYIFTRFENSLRSALKLKPKKRKNSWMIIKNSLATFKVNLANDTIAKSTPAFEYRLHHWIPQGNNKIFIDIGANIGFYSFFAINKRNFSKAYSFEANPPTYDILNENIKLSKLQHKITPVLTALGSTYEPLYFEQKEIHTGNSQITTQKEGKNIIQVKQSPFDDYISKQNIDIRKIGYIKIDVEGFESEVLTGMKKTLLELEKGTLIQIEIWGTSPNAKKSKKLLEENNFKIVNRYRSNCLYSKQ